ncbi:NAD-dependent epimerase/dehydratase family protein [Deinococcus roseus]|uniref:NAD-dependent epimerase/dehydratase domain-containing protein n=1 Tax=Deinococcus roseus TaxID=392414 RepID=A0ABQ2D414_9DEIO|nr:NAD(P)-dependent oxidoreductase [Deinococcus roseus]GGJ41547.1 hypothetical protein GCM10008938_29500 [Deinococcus roseus]
MQKTIQNVLITGAKGNIGSVLRRGLTGCFRLRLSDVEPISELTSNEEQLPCDLRDFDGVLKAMEGMDAVVHLGGIPDEAAFTDLLSVNMLGTHHIYEAARLQGVKRVVFASSNHAVGFYPIHGHIGSEVPPRPDTFYGVSKVLGEALASLYWDKFGLESVCEDWQF